MWGKRGEESSSNLFMVLIQVAIFAMFIAAVMIMVSRAVSDQTYYQRFLARDMGLTIDALHAAPGDFSMKYSFATPKPSFLALTLDIGAISFFPADQINSSSKTSSTWLFGISGNLTAGPQNLTTPNESMSRNFEIKKNTTNIFVEEPK